MGEIVVELGYEFGKRVFAQGKRSVEITHDLLKGDVDKDMIIDSLLSGPRTLLAMGRLFHQGVREFTRDLIENAEDYVQYMPVVRAGIEIGDLISR